MKVGDKVKGVPTNPTLRKRYPVVVGYYDEQEWEFGGKMHKTEFVAVGDDDVDCDFIEPASRRDKETVLS
jgi:hypothetical protein